jgi:primosomal protein N' (replication factor Y)
MSEHRQGELFPDDEAPWEIDAQATVLAAHVVFPEAPFGPYSYRIPEALANQVQPAMRVVVPLGKGDREITGYTLGVETLKQYRQNLKPILQCCDDGPLCSPNLLELVKWMSKYYLVPAGQVLEAVIPAGVRAGAGTRNQTLLRPTDKATEDALVKSLPTKQRQTLVQLILANEPLAPEQLRSLASCSDGVIKKLKETQSIFQNCLLQKSFFSTKWPELVEIYKGAPVPEKTAMSKFLSEIDPTNSQRYDKIKS